MIFFNTFHTNYEILVYIKSFGKIILMQLPVMTNISLMLKKEERHATLKKETNSAQQWCLSKMITLPNREINENMHTYDINLLLYEPTKTLMIYCTVCLFNINCPRNKTSQEKKKT